jgi:hypothetical protein
MSTKIYKFEKPKAQSNLKQNYIMFKCPNVEHFLTKTI